MNFFVDRCLSIRLARMVDAYDPVHRLRHPDDDARFTKSTPDVEWLTALARDEPKWIMLTGDGGILTNRVERKVLQSTGLKFFALTRARIKMQLYEQAWKFLKTWPHIVEAAANERGTIFEVSAAMKVHRRE